MDEVSGEKALKLWLTVALAVLRALAADPAGWRYGYDLGRQTGLQAGSLYPILMRLADRGQPRPQPGAGR